MSRRFCCLICAILLNGRAASAQVIAPPSLPVNPQVVADLRWLLHRNHPLAPNDSLNPRLNRREAAQHITNELRRMGEGLEKEVMQDRRLCMVLLRLLTEFRLELHEQGTLVTEALQAIAEPVLDDIREFESSPSSVSTAFSDVPTSHNERREMVFWKLYSRGILIGYPPK